MTLLGSVSEFVIRSSHSSSQLRADKVIGGYRDRSIASSKQDNGSRKHDRRTEVKFTTLPQPRHGIAVMKFRRATTFSLALARHEITALCMSSLSSACYKFSSSPDVQN
jgi:hypothetical protein